MKKSVALCLALFGLTLSSARANVINWGIEVPDSMFYSNANLGDTGLTADLGTFGSFIPTEFNLDQWAANWRVYDTTAVVISELGTVGFASSVQVSPIPPAPGSGFEVGTQAYIWLYNTKVFNPTLEWALVTNNNSDGVTGDNWTLPAFSEHSNNAEWFITDLPREGFASTAIFGGVGNVRGPGSYTNGIPDGDPGTPGQQYGVQTATLAAVPEPSGLLFLGSSLLLGLFRRRR
jgi:hypothetical protein